MMQDLELRDLLTSGITKSDFIDAARKMGYGDYSINQMSKRFEGVFKQKGFKDKYGQAINKMVLDAFEPVKFSVGDSANDLSTAFDNIVKSLQDADVDVTEAFSDLVANILMLVQKSNVDDKMRQIDREISALEHELQMESQYGDDDESIKAGIETKKFMKEMEKVQLENRLAQIQAQYKMVTLIADRMKQDEMLEVLKSIESLMRTGKAFEGGEGFFNNALGGALMGVLSVSSNPLIRAMGGANRIFRGLEKSGLGAKMGLGFGGMGLVSGALSLLGGSVRARKMGKQLEEAIDKFNDQMKQQADALNREEEKNLLREQYEMLKEINDSIQGLGVREAVGRTFRGIKIYRVINENWKSF